MSTQEVGVRVWGSLLQVHDMGCSQEDWGTSISSQLLLGQVSLFQPFQPPCLTLTSSPSVNHLPTCPSSPSPPFQKGSSTKCLYLAALTK